jgi:hypothetical protein
MNDLNLVVPVGDTRSFEQEAFEDLMFTVSPNIVFWLESDGYEAMVIKNAKDDYLVWFVKFTYKLVGDDSRFDKAFVECTDAQYTPHSGLDSMCLEMKIQTEKLQEACYQERYATTTPGDE